MAKADPAQTLAEWHEPQRLTRRRVDQMLASWTWKSRVGLGVLPAILFAVSFYLWGVVRGTPLGGFLPGLVEVLGASVLLVMAIPWYLRGRSAVVRITRQGVSVASGRTPTVEFGDIRRASFSTRVIDGYRIRVLILDTRTEAHVEVGIDSSITPEAIGEILGREGIPVEPDEA